MGMALMTVFVLIFVDLVPRQMSFKRGSDEAQMRFLES